MSTDRKSFEPMELVGGRYHPIGGNYGSLELASEAVKSHNRSKHGGGGSFRTYASQDHQGNTTIIEVGLEERDRMAIQAIYKVVEHLPK